MMKNEYKVGDFIKFTYIKEGKGTMILRVIKLLDNIEDYRYKVKVLNINGKPRYGSIRIGATGNLMIDYELGKYEKLSFEEGIVYEL